MAIECPECSQKFTLRNALCEDWRDPNKSFGCPHCGTFYIKDMNPNTRRSVVIQLFTVGMLLPAASIVMRYFIQGGDVYALVNAGVILISGMSIAYLNEGSAFQPLKKSPYSKACTIKINTPEED